MLPCLGPPSSSTKAESYFSPLAFPEGYSINNTPRSSALTSPTVNLTHEYTLILHSLSCGEMWSKIHHDMHPEQNLEYGQVEIHGASELLSQVLQPSREHVEEALSHIMPNTLTKLISSYFHQSEKTSHLCLLLYRSVHHARVLYAPLYALLDVLPLDISNGSHSINQSQCDWAFDIFLQFDSFDNPFLSPNCLNFDDMHHCFSQLRRELDYHLRKSRSKSHLLRQATMVAGPLCPACLPSKITKEGLTHFSQLNAAAKGTYVLHNDLDTIDRLVARLYTAVDGDKLLIRFGLERGRDKHPIQDIVRQLRKSLPNFLNQLSDLEEHLCLCLLQLIGQDNFFLMRFIFIRLVVHNLALAQTSKDLCTFISHSLLWLLFRDSPPFKIKTIAVHSTHEVMMISCSNWFHYSLVIGFSLCHCSDKSLWSFWVGNF